MYLKIYIIATILTISNLAICQTVADTNKIDHSGYKQGYWIKKSPDGAIIYEGTFRDDHPVGEFKRYYPDKTVKSVLIYSSDGRSADATIYYPNGFIASKGKYVDKKKEGKWQFYSSSTQGYLINEEFYSGNVRNGLSLKYYPDSTIAEKVNYINDKKEGEWLQFYPDGKQFLRSFYSGNLLNGKFEVWFENGKNHFSGTYKNNMRDGKWCIYNDDGSLRYELNYVNGMTKDKQMDIDASDFFDNLEKNKDKIADPEKTGEIR